MSKFSYTCLYPRLYENEKFGIWCRKNTWGIPRQFGDDVSDVLRNLFVGRGNPCRKILNFLKIFVLFVLEKKKSPLSKIWKNSHKSYKIYQNFWAELENENCKTAPVKKKTKNWKKSIEMHSLHRNKQKSSF